VADHGLLAARPPHGDRGEPPAVDYVGTWLPDFVHTETGDDPGEQAALASSVTTAFLLLLERLTPKERAAFVLQPNWSPHVLVDAQLNAAPGLELIDSGRITAAVSFAYDDAGRVVDIFIMRNPDKLARIGATPGVG
jgi:hypothetical protein